jgi:hypothetical protein
MVGQTGVVRLQAIGPMEPELVRGEVRLDLRLIVT